MFYVTCYHGHRIHHLLQNEKQKAKKFKKVNSELRRYLYFIYGVWGIKTSYR